ncbi:succinyl-CoA:acetate CoA-transferase [Microvirga guangxiensis]|uniref:Succinyl-CoA:acetate CoA-transferase n=1 Tax=Microvirga guangxiensis TaxID=549386 RepID=A0A1G5KA01_9HYPH|nr:succinyl-CoA:acetate CoA-transferase [Microvirga guangxiensis]
MHDIYYGTRLTHPSDRIGIPYLTCDPDKIVAIVETNQPDRNTTSTPPDETSRLIAGHMIGFLQHEVKKGGLSNTLLLLQSGVGNVANAVFASLKDSPFENLTATRKCFRTACSTCSPMAS